MQPIAFICAVELESAPLLSRITAVESVEVGSIRGWRGTLGHRDVVLLESGMGKTNAAHVTTVLLERASVSCVVNFGVAGAYRRSGMTIGDIAIATSEIYGDEGVETPTGWLSCEGIGIPLLKHGPDRFYNEFPVDGHLLQRAEIGLKTSSCAYSVGPFVTVSTCSGTLRRGTELAERHSAICETMEGAAVAHICAAYGVPFLEVRGISNLVEDRDLSGWDLESGARASACAAAIIGASL